MDNPPDFMAQWDYRDPPPAPCVFMPCCPRRAAADLQYELELLTQIARTHSLQRQFAEAHQLLDEIEPRLTDATPQARLRALLARYVPSTPPATRPAPRRCLSKPGSWGSSTRSSISPSTPPT